jgi:hypothetical protein
VSSESLRAIIEAEAEAEEEEEEGGAPPLAEPDMVPAQSLDLGGEGLVVAVDGLPRVTIPRAIPERAGGGGGDGGG